MCKSVAEGGQRCAAHTRPVYERTSMDDPKWEAVAAAYASTKEGHQRLSLQAEQSATHGVHDREAQLRSALVRGENIRNANADSGTLIAKTRLSTWEPKQIDEQLASLYEQRYALLTRLESERVRLAQQVNTRIHGNRVRSITNTEAEEAIQDLYGTEPSKRPSYANDLLHRYERIQTMSHGLEELDKTMVPYHKEFERRNGWTRAFLVTNSGGHVHRSMQCSTCFPSTRYHWVTEYSGKKEDNIVDAAGSRACTVCYPSAPVEVRQQPTRIFSPEEISQQHEREEREQRSRERENQKIEKSLTSDGSKFRITYRQDGYNSSEEFQTERAATSWVVSSISDFRTWRQQSMDSSLDDAHQKIISAVAEKHGLSISQVKEDIERKVQAKIVRDQRHS